MVPGWKVLMCNKYMKQCFWETFIDVVCKKEEGFTDFYHHIAPPPPRENHRNNLGSIFRMDPLRYINWSTQKSTLWEVEGPLKDLVR